MSIYPTMSEELASESFSNRLIRETNIQLENQNKLLKRKLKIATMVLGGYAQHHRNNKLDVGYHAFRALKKINNVEVQQSSNQMPLSWF